MTKENLNQSARIALEAKTIEDCLNGIHLLRNSCFINVFYHQCYQKQNVVQCQNAYKNVPQIKSSWRKIFVEKAQVAELSRLILVKEWKEAVHFFKKNVRFWNVNHSLELLLRLLKEVKFLDKEDICQLIQVVLKKSFSSYGWIKQVPWDMCLEELERIDFQWQNFAKNLIYGEHKKVTDDFLSYLEKVGLIRSYLMIAFFTALTANDFSKAEDYFQRIQALTVSEEERVHVFRMKYLLEARLGELPKAITTVKTIWYLNPSKTVQRELFQDGVNFYSQLLDDKGLEDFIKSNRIDDEAAYYHSYYQLALVKFVLGDFNKADYYLNQIPAKYQKSEHLFLKALVNIQTKKPLIALSHIRRLARSLFVEEFFSFKSYPLLIRPVADVEEGFLLTHTVPKNGQMCDVNDWGNVDPNVPWEYVLLSWPNCISQSLVNGMVKRNEWGYLYEYLMSVDNQLLVDWMKKPISSWLHRIINPVSVDLELILSITQAESGFDPLAFSNVGARGVMQLLPLTAMRLKEKFKLKEYEEPDSLWDPWVNFKLGAAYFTFMEQAADKSCLPLWIAGFNAGWHRAQTWWFRWPKKANWWLFVEWIPYAQTREYVKKVLGYYRHLGGYFNPFINLCQLEGKIQLVEEW